MELDGVLGQFGRPLQVLFVDLMLAGDNALMVALVCHTLPPQHQRRAMFLGTVGAVALRFVMSAAAMTLLMLPAVKLVGAALLVMIALNLVQPRAETPELDDGPPAIVTFLAAGILLAMVDFIMSLDNIVALAAVAQGSVLYLGIGLLLSIPFLYSGNEIMMALFRRYPGLVLMGGAVLGWVAGGMMVSDPLVTGWVAGQAPALDTVVPALTALYVVALGRMAPRRRFAPPARSHSSPPPRIRAEQPSPEEAVTRVSTDQMAPPVQADDPASRQRRRDRILFLIMFAIGSGMLAAAAILGGFFS